MTQLRNAKRNALPRAIHGALLAGVLGLGACGMMPMMSGSSALTARLSGANEVPAVAGMGSGTVDATLDKKTHVLSWTVAYAGLSGPATGAHFHGPAMVGENAEVAMPIAGDLASPIRGQATLTAAQAADVMAGKWYLNLHTATHPNGELRGRLTVRP